VTRVETERIFKKLDREAESAGYHLNPNREFTLGLIEGMLVNELRYGYWACPCRLASGNKAEDLDIICPCDYRDPDLAQHGTCYCALYVSQDIVDGRRKPARIPERRQAERRSGPSAAPADAASPANSASPNDAAAGAASAAPSAASAAPNLSGLSYPLWRCRVCGYLCARDGPPEVCPICRAKKDRFERFL
jgi:ferredoxin-thioredoxin reductase catalytic subunit